MKFTHSIFCPTPSFDQHLGIEQTLRERIAEIHESIGEDSPILEPDEKLNEKAMYAIYEGDGKALETFEEAEEQYDSLGIQAAEDFIRRLEREEPEFMAKIKRLPNALRTARNLSWPQPQDSALSQVKEKPAISSLAKPRNFKSFILPMLTEKSLRRPDGSHCGDPLFEEEPAAQLPANYNSLVEKLRAQFEKAFAEHLAAGGLPHRFRHRCAKHWTKFKRSLSATKDEEEKNKLAHLRELFRLPLDARTESELRDWRRTISDEPEVNVERLTDIAFSCKLEDLWAEQTRHKSVQKESVPMIICTEALI